MGVKLVSAGQSRESGAGRGLRPGERLPEAPSALSEATYSSDTREFGQETAEGVPLARCFELVLSRSENRFCCWMLPAPALVGTSREIIRFS
jgi:hypothetical protein